MRWKVLLKYRRGLPALPTFSFLKEVTSQLLTSWCFFAAQWCQVLMDQLLQSSPVALGCILQPLFEHRADVRACFASSLCWGLACCTGTWGRANNMQLLTWCCSVSLGPVLWCPWLCLALPQQPQWLWIMLCLTLTACMLFHISSGIKALYSDGSYRTSSAASYWCASYWQTAPYCSEGKRSQ